MGQVKQYDREAIIPIILDAFAAGESVRSICRRHKDFPSPNTIRLWAIQDDPPGFAAQYARARDMHADALIEEAREIADDGSRDTIVKKGKDGREYEAPDYEWMKRSQLRVDIRKWAAAKLAPRKYGDRLELSGDPERPVTKAVWRFGAKEIEF